MTADQPPDVLVGHWCSTCGAFTWPGNIVPSTGGHVGHDGRACTGQWVTITYERTKAE